jgi:hypothetical protein
MTILLESGNGVFVSGLRPNERKCVLCLGRQTVAPTLATAYRLIDDRPPIRFDSTVVNIDVSLKILRQTQTLRRSYNRRKSP